MADCCFSQQFYSDEKEPFDASVHIVFYPIVCASVAWIGEADGCMKWANLTDNKPIREPYGGKEMPDSLFVEELNINVWDCRLD